MRCRKIKTKNMSIYYRKTDDKLIIQMDKPKQCKTYLVNKGRGIFFSCKENDDKIIAIEIDGFSRKDPISLNDIIPAKIDYSNIRRRFRL